MCICKLMVVCIVFHEASRSTEGVIDGRTDKLTDTVQGTQSCILSLCLGNVFCQDHQTVWDAVQKKNPAFKRAREVAISHY
jgi:hypothetical protein